MKIGPLLLSLLLVAPIAANAAGPVTGRAWTGQVVSLKNGIKLKAEGSKLTITSADGTSSVLERSDPVFTHPTAPVPASCASMMRFMESHEVSQFWRAVSVNYMNNCL
jgi:hypothetical protein